MSSPSFADAIATIAADTTLDTNKKRFWSTSLRQLAAYLGKSPETLPGRISAISSTVSKLHPERLGINAKTFANHRANAKAALNWFNHKSHGSPRSAPMAPPFCQLWGCISDRYAKDMLSPFFRFLTALSIAPDMVTDGHVAAYAEHRRQSHFKPLKIHHQRQLVRYWNACRRNIPGWPAITLTEAAYAKAHEGPAWNEFPNGLRSDIDAYCVALAKTRYARDRRLLRPRAPSTIELARRVLVARRWPSAFPS